MYEPEHDEREQARLEGRIAAARYRIGNFADAVDGCAECERWRRLRHPLQPMCDRHYRELRQIPGSECSDERLLFQVRGRLHAYEAGLRAGAALAAMEAGVSPRPVPRRYERPAAELERIAAALRELGRDGTSATAPGCSVSSALIELSLAAECVAEMIEALADEDE